MPEGDTIWRTAARLRPALEGFRVVRFEADRSAAVPVEAGTPIEAVEAKGKYLLVHFEEFGSEQARTLETHMKMTGSWHLYRSGERWQRSVRSARAVVEADSGWVAVCFSAPHVVLRPRRSGPDHLGPDLTGPDPDLDVAVDRFRQFADRETPIGVALLDQRICCGVGNVYKSEVLHACQLDPRSLVLDVPIEGRAILVQTAHRLLRMNLGSGPRVTVPGGLAAYGRAGESCPRCGAAIERIVQGEHARSTYWCPGCQDDQVVDPVLGAEPGRTRPDS